MPDFFDALLNLEEEYEPGIFAMLEQIFYTKANPPASYYQEGYNEGLADGEQAGHTEGRIFGLEKGFEKFTELGILQGRCAVWKARIPPSSSSPSSIDSATRKLPKEAEITNPRAQRQINSLALLLTHPPFKNDEESVEEVEETLKRGRGKATVLKGMLGEKDGSGKGKKKDEDSIEDAGRGARGSGKV